MKININPWISECRPLFFTGIIAYVDTHVSIEATIPSADYVTKHTVKLSQHVPDGY